MKSLVEDLLSPMVHKIAIVVLFLAEKSEEVFALQKFLRFFFGSVLCTIHLKI